MKWGKKNFTNSYVPLQSYLSIVVTKHDISAFVAFSMPPKPHSKGLDAIQDRLSTMQTHMELKN